jgi:uncharacterized protein DUF3592
MRAFLCRKRGLKGSGLIGGLGLVAIVLCMLGLLVMGVWNICCAAGQRSWQAVPCKIESSRIEETFDSKGNRRFRVPVKYSYEFGEKKFTGHRTSMSLRFLGPDRGGAGEFTKWTAAEDELKRYAPGSASQCYVNPRDPNEAALRRLSLTHGIVLTVIPFGLGLLLFGYRISGWLRRKREPAEAKPTSVLSIMSDPALREARQALLWGGLLAIMGGFCTAFLFVEPLLLSRAAKSWPEVPCMILESGMRKDSTRHGDEYKPDVLYEFEFAGKKHRSNQTHFENGEPDSLSDTARFVARFPAGGKSVCYVNPKNPRQSVLDRSFPLISSFYPLIGLCMFGGGVAGVGWGLWTICRRKSRSAPAGPVAPGLWGAPSNPNPVTLRPLSASIAVLLASLVGLVILGAILGWRVLRFWHNWRELGVIEFSLFEILILLFVLAGVGWCALRCWKYFDPQPKLQLGRGSVALGDAVELEWNFTGPVGRLRSLKIGLEGREEGKVVQEEQGAYGVKFKTEKLAKELFYSAALFTSQTQADRAQGRINVPLPRDRMPTFNGDKTQIVWVIQFEGDVEWSTPMKHEFPLNVLPAGAK